MSTPLILLASNSPRRRVLLSWTGWPFEVRPADIDETQAVEETPQDYVMRLAHEKALAASEFETEATVILAADTVVVFEDEVLGKPESSQQAEDFLRRLRGRVHEVYTAIALIDRRSGELLTDLCHTLVPMRDYSDAEIAAYVASGEPMDKAGAYGIQSTEFHPVTDFEGCYASVMGLPLCHLVRTMAILGFEPSVDVPAVCQKNLNYVCPVYRAILEGEDEG